jgi:hypothetical protein
MKIIGCDFHPSFQHGHLNNWDRLHRELQARMVLVEFKNYDAEDVGKDEVNQTRNYLTKPMGRLAIIMFDPPPGSVGPYQAQYNLQRRWEGYPFCNGGAPERNDIYQRARRRPLGLNHGSRRKVLCATRIGTQRIPSFVCSNELPPIRLIKSLLILINLMSANILFFGSNRGVSLLYSL